MSDLTSIQRIRGCVPPQDKIGLVMSRLLFSVFVCICNLTGPGKIYIIQFKSDTDNLFTGSSIQNKVILFRDFSTAYTFSTVAS